VGPAAAAQAQIAGSEEPFITDGAGRTYLGTTPLRIWHRTRGYGQEAAETAFGGRAALDLAGAVGFMDGQFRISNESQFGANVGGGVRWQYDGLLAPGGRILGVTGWYDGQETELGNYFNQGGVSLESLGEYIDLRLNANIPIEDTKQGDDVRFTGVAGFTGNFLTQGTVISQDVALRVVDFEVAPRIYNLNAWFYGGGYQMDGEGISEFGGKGGVRGYVTNDLAVDVGVSDDDVFGTLTVAQFIWTPGRTGSGPTSWVHTLADRMREPVYRNTYVATAQREIAGAVNLTDATGDDIRIVHVDSNATAPGDGSFENPYTSLASLAGAGTEQGDIILVHADTTYLDQSAILKDEQRFLGEGGGVEHTITTSQLGSVVIPESSAGARNGAIPIIDNSGTALNAVLLAVGNDEVSTFSPIEISNFDIRGGARAVYSDDDGAGAPTGVGGVNINQLTISNTTGNAIELNPLQETLADSSQRFRFQPTIDDITFTGVGGDDIRLTMAEANATSTVENIVISDITSTGGNGVGINLIGNKRAVTITDFEWDGGATGDGALRIEDAVGNVTMNGTNVIENGQSGTAFAISLVDGAGVHTVTGTTITNTGGDSIVANGGTGDLNFTGRIDQANVASVVSVSGGHDGDLSFRELTAGAGVIGATAGDGLQFNDADGTYTFVDAVELTGTVNAVNVANGSDAVITLSEAEFTNTTATTIIVDGGAANISLTGSITQSNNAAVLNVQGGHTGTLTFNELTSNAGVITATNGTGLQFNDADGSYTFNDRVFLNGGDAGVDVTNGSAGTFNFVDLDITNPTGVALNIDGSNVVFTSSGDITANNANAVTLQNNTGGSVTINNAITSDEGILVNANTGGTFLFSGQTTLTGTSDGVLITNNTAGSTQFSNVDVTKTGAGRGFVATSAAPGHTVTVLAGNGNVISTQTGVALQLNNIAAGGAGITFQSVSSDGAANGISITNVTGGAVNIGSSGAVAGAGGTIANSTGNAVAITNASNVTLNGLDVENTAAGFDGIEINHTNGVASTVTINNAEITGAGAMGIDYNRTASGTSRLTLNATVINTTTDESVNIDIGGSGAANLSIVNNNQFTNTDDEALVITTSGGAGKTVNLLVDGGTFTNNSTASTVDIATNGSGTVNATITDNTFTNNDAVSGRAFDMESVSPASTIRLNLNNNTGVNGSAANEFLLTETAGDFRIQDVATADDRNSGAIDFVPNQAAFTDDPGPIPPPQ
jgi:hypothetical protein